MRYLISPTAWGMLTSPTGWGMLAGLVGLLGYLPYLRDAWRRTSQPDPAAWLIWTVEYSVLLAAQAAQHPPWAALCLAGLQLAGTCAVLAVLAVRGEWRWGFGRGVLLGGSVAVMAVWRFTHTPATAMCLVLAVEGAGMVLVILGAYRRPGSETPLTWKAFTLAGLLDLRALSGQTAPLLYAYPAFFVVMGSGVLTAIALGRQRARRAARRLMLHPQDDPESLITICHEAHGARGHWVLAAPRPWLAPSRPGIPAAAGPAPPAAAAQRVLPARTVRPVLPATTVQPALPATTVQPVLPATAVQPALPATTVQPVAPATTVQPVLPATAVQPALPADAQPVPPPAPQRRAIPAARPVPASRRVWPESDPGWPASQPARPESDPARPESDPAPPAAGLGWPASEPGWPAADPGWRVADPGWPAADPGWPAADPGWRVAGPAGPESWRRRPREAPPLDLAERRERAR
jgi:hypothetical protein